MISDTICYLVQIDARHQKTNNSPRRVFVCPRSNMAVLKVLVIIGFASYFQLWVALTIIKALKRERTCTMLRMTLSEDPFCGGKCSNCEHQVEDYYHILDCHGSVGLPYFCPSCGHKILKPKPNGSVYK